MLLMTDLVCHQSGFSILIIYAIAIAVVCTDIFIQLAANIDNVVLSTFLN